MISVFFFLLEIVCVSMLAGAATSFETSRRRHTLQQRELFLSLAASTCPSQGTLCLDQKKRKKSLSNTCTLVCGSGHLPVKEHARGQLRTTRTLGTFASVFSALRLEGHIPHRLRRGLWPRGGDSNHDRWMLPSEFLILAV